MLPEELITFKEMMRRFIDRELVPLEPSLPLSAEDKGDLQQKVQKAGFWMPDVPEELGGQGLGMLAMSVFWHEISRTPVVDSRDHSLFGPAVGPILLNLDEAQKENYLLPVLRGEKKACFAQTEPDAGSDPGMMKTRAVRDGDHYVVNGTKRYITGARDADFAQVIAVTDPERGTRGGMSCLLVDMDAEGVEIAREQETMMGDRPCEIVFSDVRVPAANLVGEEGDGFKVAQGWLNTGRIRHGARACGVAERCLDITVEYLNQRKTFGEYLSNRQGVQWMIADCYTEMHATWLMVTDTARKIDEGKDARIECYMVKTYGDEMGFRVADKCMQLLGGLGLTTDLPVEKMWRDQRSFRITEGPTEVLRTAMARQLMRGGYETV